MTKQIEELIGEIGKRGLTGKHMKGKHRSEETKKKMSVAQMGHVVSPKTKKKMSEMHKRIGVPWLIGHKFSQKALEKMRIAKIGTKHSLVARRKMSLWWTGLPEEKNNSWKGDKVGYFGLHMWVRKWLGKPEICIGCGSDKFLQWANKTGEYKRDLDDWISLCCSCHKKYDKVGKKLEQLKLIERIEKEVKGYFHKMATETEGSINGVVTFSTHDYQKNGTDLLSTLDQIKEEINER